MLSFDEEELAEGITTAQKSLAEISELIYAAIVLHDEIVELGVPSTGL
jgi:hypothetical protein